MIKNVSQLTGRSWNNVNKALKMSMPWKLLKGVLLACWLSVSFISLNHLYPVFPFFSKLSTGFLGWLGWSTVFLAILFYGRDHIRQLFFLVLAFFLVGFLLGPFLEPPADPFEHLRRVHEENCSKIAEDVPRQNRGLWHYSMVGVLLCKDSQPVHAEKMLRNIDITNGIFWALLAAVLFILGKRVDLPGRWAFLSVLICFLFFGTNRFSYFRYYSLAPSFSSIFIYWLWIAIFFFKNNRHDIVVGLASALVCMPLLWVNHRQEAVFLGFIVMIWLVLNIVFSWGKRSFVPVTEKQVRHGLPAKLFTFNSLGFLFLFIILWLLPQFDFFRQSLSQFFIQQPEWDSPFVVIWLGLYRGGGVTGRLRVADTLGGVGIIMALLSIPYLWIGFVKGTFERKVRIYTLAVLPFIGYFIPLFHFIWFSNVDWSQYYRLCYASMYWILFADFFFSVEQGGCNVVSWAKSFAGNMTQRQLKK